MLNQKTKNNMELNFTKQAEGYVAEFEATTDFNLHIEREGSSPLAIFHTSVEGSEYDSIDLSGYNNRKHKTIDIDYVSTIYPKWVKVVLQEPVINAVVTY